MAWLQLHPIFILLLPIENSFGKSKNFSIKFSAVWRINISFWLIRIVIRPMMPIIAVPNTQLEIDISHAFSLENRTAILVKDGLNKCRMCIFNNCLEFPSEFLWTAAVELAWYRKGTINNCWINRPAFESHILKWNRALWSHSRGKCADGQRLYSPIKLSISNLLTTGVDIIQALLNSASDT